MLPGGLSRMAPTSGSKLPKAQRALTLSSGNELTLAIRDWKESGTSANGYADSEVRRV
jgi:hypothetical protein